MGVKHKYLDDIGVDYSWVWKPENSDRQMVDLNFHKFNYKEKEYTQLEMINMMLERLEYYFNEDAFDNKVDEYRKQGIDILEANNKAYEPIKEIGEIWAIVLPAMWW